MLLRKGRVASIHVGKKSKIAIFNITADDHVTMLFPCEYAKDHIVSENAPFVFPRSNHALTLFSTRSPDTKETPKQCL